MDDVHAPATPSGQSAGKPHGGQLLLLIGGGFILAFGGCLTFLGTASTSESSIPVVAALAFIAGVLMFGIGIVAAVIMAIAGAFRTATR